MNRQLTSFFVLAACASAIAFVCLATLQPIWQADQQITALTDDLAALRKRLAQASMANAALEDRKAQLRLLMDAGDPATVSASLQEGARNAIASAGGQLMSAQTLVVDLGSGFRKVSLQMHARTDEATFLTFLRDQEFAEPPAVVELLEVQQLPGVAGLQSLDINVTLSRIVADAPAT